MDSNGAFDIFYLSKGPLFSSGVMKIVSGLISIYIGRETLRLTKPVLVSLGFPGRVQITERKA